MSVLERSGEAPISMKHFVYILQTKEGTFYTGMTKNLQARLDLHNQGKGAKYTKGRRPVKLVYFEELKNFKSAMQREVKIQSYPRKKKEKLIEEFKANFKNE